MERTELNVEGMSCPSCISHIEHALRNVKGVAKVDVRVREGKVVVQHDATGVERLIAALQDAGYEASKSG
jgi:copper chaperone